MQPEVVRLECRGVVEDNGLQLLLLNLGDERLWAGQRGPVEANVEAELVEDHRLRAGQAHVEADPLLARQLKVAQLRVHVVQARGRLLHKPIPHGTAGRRPFRDCGEVQDLLQNGTILAVHGHPAPNVVVHRAVVPGDDPLGMLQPETGAEVRAVCDFGIGGQRRAVDVVHAVVLATVLRLVEGEVGANFGQPAAISAACLLISLLLVDDLTRECLLNPTHAVLDPKDHFGGQGLEVRPWEETVDAAVHLDDLPVALVGHEFVKELGHALAGHQGDAPIRRDLQDLMVLQEAHPPVAVEGPAGIRPIVQGDVHRTGDHEGGRPKTPHAILVTGRRLQLQRWKLFSDHNLCVGALVFQLWPGPGLDSSEGGRPLGGVALGARLHCRHHTDAPVHAGVGARDLREAPELVRCARRVRCGGKSPRLVQGEPRLLRRTDHLVVRPAAHGGRQRVGRDLLRKDQSRGRVRHVVRGHNDLDGLGESNSLMCGDLTLHREGLHRPIHRGHVGDYTRAAVHGEVESAQTAARVQGVPGRSARQRLEVNGSTEDEPGVCILERCGTLVPSLAFAARLVAALAVHRTVVTIRRLQGLARVPLLVDPVDGAEARHAAVVLADEASITLLARSRRKVGTAPTICGFHGAATRRCPVVEEVPERELPGTGVAPPLLLRVVYLAELLRHGQWHRRLGLRIPALGSQLVEAAVDPQLLTQVSAERGSGRPGPRPVTAP